jgi:CDP-diglyceride synthetase
MQPLVVTQLLVLLTLANGAPVVAKKILGGRFAWPLDGGMTFFDGRPLFGKSKTVRGIVLAVLATAAGAPLVGLAWPIGALVGAAAMAGDLGASFVKRRMNRPSSTRATGLDQIPEALLPLLACRGALALSALDIAAGVAAFFVGEILLSRLFYKLHLRDEPY